MIILSFILEGLISNLISIQTKLFNPLFTLISLILFNHKYNLKKYLIISFCIGLLYDIIYTNTLFLNAFIFLLLSYLTYIIFKIINNNLINRVIVSVASIFIYRIIVYLILITRYSISYKILINSITSSLLINIIYILIIILINIIRKKT